MVCLLVPVCLLVLLPFLRLPLVLLSHLRVLSPCTLSPLACHSSPLLDLLVCPLAPLPALCTTPHPRPQPASLHLCLPLCFLTHKAAPRLLSPPLGLLVCLSVPLPALPPCLFTPQSALVPFACLSVPCGPSACLSVLLLTLRTAPQTLILTLGLPFSP